MPVRLLFDHNLSPTLLFHLHDISPESRLVYHIGLEESADVEVWEYAAANGLVNVTKDADYLAISARRGHPSKVVHIGLGNGPTVEVAALLRLNYGDIMRFHRDESVAFIELRSPCQRNRRAPPGRGNDGPCCPHLTKRVEQVVLV